MVVDVTIWSKVDNKGNLDQLLREGFPPKMEILMAFAMMGGGVSRAINVF